MPAVSAPSPVPFTSLVQPTSSVSATPAAASFDAATANLLAQCCVLTYTQFDQGTISTADFAAIGPQLTGALAGYTVAAMNLTPFTVSEAVEPGPTTGDAGDYALVQGGFGVLLALTRTGEPTRDFTVIALRGTRTFAEWLDDASALPVPFAGVIPTSGGLGSVHGGFYAAYTVGTDGVVAPSGQELSPTPGQRATGSLAAQVAAFADTLQGANVYVTGHSLGAALATLCALDVAYNFSAKTSSLALYALASPRVAVGLSDSFGVSIPTMSNQAYLQGMFQSFVPNAYQIVHAADIIPILPPLSTTLGPLTVSCAQVTDAWQIAGSGATATAEISGGVVTKVTVNAAGSDYAVIGSPPPPVVFSGGGGSGATALASVGAIPFDDYGTITAVNIVDGGSGYTSPPTVTIASSSPGVPAAVISFCAQTGDIGNNHGCVITYAPYLQELAGGFS